MRVRLPQCGEPRFAASWRQDTHRRSSVRRLAREGCHRTAVTVRSWLKDDRLIGPKDALDGALEAIQRATEDDELQKKVEACKEANPSGSQCSLRGCVSACHSSAGSHEGVARHRTHRQTSSWRSKND